MKNEQEVHEDNLLNYDTIRYCTPSESLKESLKEMKLIREGKKEKRSYWDMMKNEQAMRNTMLEFQDIYTKTYEQNEQLKTLRNKLNASYEKLMNQDEEFLKLTDEEKSKYINDFRNKSFDEIIRNNTSH